MNEELKADRDQASFDYGKAMKERDALREEVKALKARLETSEHERCIQRMHLVDARDDRDVAKVKAASFGAQVSSLTEELRLAREEVEKWKTIAKHFDRT